METGIIKSVGDKIIVAKENTDNCNSCKMKMLCHNQSITEFEVITSEKFAIGEKVEIIINPYKRIFASFIVFILPVLILIITYYISFSLFFKSEPFSIVLSIISLLISYVIIKYINKKVDNNNDIKIKKLEERNENSS